MLSFFYHFFLYIELVKPDSRAGARLLWQPYFLSAECAYPIKEQLPYYTKRPQALHRLATTAIQDSISLFAINFNHNPYK